MKLNNIVLSAKVVIILMATLVLMSCGTNNPINNNSINSEFNENIISVMTWNLKEFPYQNENTINELQYLIPSLNADVIAVQEIANTDAFDQLDSYLNDYESIASEDYIYDSTDEDSYYNPILGFIYHKDRVSVKSAYEILKYDSRLFPREPFVLEITWRDEDFVIINNHLKAGGDNEIDYNDEWDQEVRRLEALNELHAYIVENYDDENVILLGDFNDQSHEIPQTNVFTAFLDDDDFMFADYEMSLNSDDYSYPNWPSHLDHIIINQNLFEAFGKENSSCYTIKLDTSISNYNSTISDHRPVILKLDYE